VPNSDEWLWGWDPTPGIVSVWAEPQGRATVWRRLPNGTLVRDVERFRPWILLDSIEDIDRANRAGTVDIQELDGPGELRYLASADDWTTIVDALTAGASQRTGQRITRLHELDRSRMHVLPPEEQYLVATGRTYFRDLEFDALHRLQFDLETTGLDPSLDRIFLIAVRAPDGSVELLEAEGDDDAAERALIRQLMARIAALDPDVIENHNLHGFDLPFLRQRARRLGVRLVIGRVDGAELRERGAMRGTRSDGDVDRRVRFVAPGRECIDTLDAVRRYDFATRELPGYGLKAVAKHLRISGPERELIRGDQIHTVYRTDPDRVRRYATADVEEVAALARLLGGAAFALARIAPRRYERLADAGAATGVIDPMLVRAYLRAGQALPAHQDGDGTVHSGAALHLFTVGVAHRVVKADVASLYPSLMRAWRIGPARDHLGALLALVDRLVDQRLISKARAREAPAGSPERTEHEAMSAAMKLVVNSAYGYLAAGGGLTRFADVHAANEVTRRGRETLAQLCRELAARGATLIEADTDGVYFAVPATWSEADERRVVAEVAALLPPLVQLEYEGRYAAMLSHEAKNYALRGYDGRLTVRGVAFRSSRAEPCLDRLLRAMIGQLLDGDVVGMQATYLAAIDALRRRAYPVLDVASRVRLRRTAAAYAKSRAVRKEFVYEAMLESGRATWSVGDRVRVYRAEGGRGRVIDEVEGDPRLDDDVRDYDGEYYATLVKRTVMQRLARAFAVADVEMLLADGDQLSLFARRVEGIRPVARFVKDTWEGLGIEMPVPLSS
jgi:DNA polymerase, archaea type